MIRNERGSIMVITTAFVLMFTMLGLASFHIAGVQANIQEQQRASADAFWLTDGAIQQALHYVRNPPGPISTDENNPTILTPDPLLGPNVSGNARSYSVALTHSCYKRQAPTGTEIIGVDAEAIDDPVAIAAYPCIQYYGDRWKARATATVNNKARRIAAVFSEQDIANIITTTDIVNNESPDCEKNPQTDLITGKCDQNAIFSFESVFNGLTLTDFKNAALYTYNNPANANAVDPIGGITVINLTTKNSLNLNADNLIDTTNDSINNPATFLIVDGSALNSDIDIQINGTADFRGIIWIIGRANFRGNGKIVGSVFIDAPPPTNSVVSGSMQATFSESAVNDALGTFGGGLTPDTPYIVAWKEY